jgi:hypothetical protein
MVGSAASRVTWALTLDLGVAVRAEHGHGGSGLGSTNVCRGWRHGGWRQTLGEGELLWPQVEVRFVGK